jgi:hypothetical protein
MFQNFASSEIFYNNIVEEFVRLDCDTESLGKQFQHFEGVYCLHLQELRVLRGPSP